MSKQKATLENSSTKGLTKSTSSIEPMNGTMEFTANQQPLGSMGIRAKALDDLPFTVIQRQILASKLGNVYGNRFFNILQRDNENLERTQAIAGLLEWHRNYIEFVETSRSWLSNNMTQYFSMTSSDPRLGLSKEDLQRIIKSEFSDTSGLPLEIISTVQENSDSVGGVFHSVMSNTAGNAITEYGPRGVKAISGIALGEIGAAIGALFGIPGAAVGFIVGVLVESAASALYDCFLESAGWGGNDTAMAEGSRLAGRLIRENNTRISQDVVPRLTKSYQILSELMTLVNTASTQAQIDTVMERAKKQTALCQKRPSENDTSLSKRLLGIWVLEHAADEDGAKEGTSEAQWEAARKSAFDSGNWDDLNGVPDLFVYQTRLHWKNSGLNGEQYLNEMFEHKRFLDQPTYSHIATGDKTNMMKLKFHNKRKFIFTSNVDIGLFAKLISLIHPVHSAFFSDFAKDGYRIICSFNLSISNDSCYVNEWEYTVESPSSHVTFTSFSISPG